MFQTGNHTVDDILKDIFWNGDIWFSLNIRRVTKLKGFINNMPTMVWVMARDWIGDKPLFKPKMALFSNADMHF